MWTTLMREPRPDDQASGSSDVELEVALSTRAFRFSLFIGRWDDLELIGETFQQEIRSLGMTASASGMVSGPKQTFDKMFHFVNWPADWLTLYEACGYVQLDPVPRWAIVSGAPISWTELMQTLPLDDPGHEIYAKARQWGFTEGFVTPVRALDGSLGLVSVGGDRGSLRLHERLFLQAISVVTLHRAEAISAMAGPPHAPPSLNLPIGAAKPTGAGPFHGVLNSGSSNASPETLLGNQFGLTAAELRVVLGLYQGQSLSGLAALSKTSVNTLRVQLANIFLKTNTHRQVELIKVIRVVLSPSEDA